MSASVAAKKPNDGPAEVKAVAQRLALAHREVHAALAGRAQHRQRQRVARGDAQRPGLVRGAGQRLEVLDGAEEVGLLDDHRAHLLVDRRQLGDAVAQRRLDDLHAPAVSQGGQRLTGVRMHAAGDDEA